MTTTAIERDPDRGLDAEDLRPREVAELGVLEEHDEVAVGDQRAEAADHERHRQRGDQRVDAQARDDEAVDEPDGEPDADAQHDGDRRRRALAISAAGHAGQRVHGAHREVDAAGHEDERPGRRDDQRRRLLIEDVEQVDLRQERRARDRQRDEERREGQRDAGRAQALDGARGAGVDAAASARRAAMPRSRRSCRERGGQDRRLGHLLARELADDPPRAHHEHAVREPEDLLELGGDEQHAEALVGQRRRAGRRSRAWRRRRRRAWARRRSSTCGPHSSMRAKSSFCWLPPDSELAGRAGAVRAHRPALERLARAPALGAAAHEAVAADARPGWPGRRSR